MTTKTRVTKLEKKNGVRSDLWYVWVLPESGETKDDSLRRTLEKKGLDHSMIGCVSYYGGDFDCQQELLNGYSGDIRNLRGCPEFDKMLKDILDEIDGETKGLPN